MNRTAFFFASLALAAAATSALADDPTVDPHVFAGARSRAEVQAEFGAWRQAGVDPWASAYSPLKEFHSVASRSEVQGEYLAAREEVRARTGEDSGSSYLAQRRVMGADTQLAQH